MSLCNVDPDILNFVTNSPLVLNPAGASVGNRIQTGEACSANFALEVWTDIPNGVCALTGVKEYGYFVAPCIGKGILGDFTIENDALNLELTAKARSGSGWGNGPFDVDPSTATLPVVPGPLLTPFGPIDVLDLHRTTVPPPDETDGCIAMPA